MQESSGTLYLCATPIGNLEDITLRVLRVLREADEIWAEDTRRTLQLLNHYEIKGRLLSCHAHNEATRAEQLATLLRAGKTIAYCSDAGMPGISDPGARLVARCIAEGLPCVVLPGASASIMAAVLSGLNCDRFRFYGFAPRDKKSRDALLAAIRKSREMSILYESPQRLPGLLRALREALGERQAAVLRELTKLHEECRRGTLGELAEAYAEPPRGEIVLVIDGCGEEDASLLENANAELLTKLKNLHAQGLSVRDMAAAATELLGVERNRAYEAAMLAANEE